MITPLADFEDFFSVNSFKRTKVEDNFFNIGARRFYENPFTEVLGYILDSATQYQYRQEFLRILLDDIVPESSMKSLLEFSSVLTQYSTDNGNFIDLVLYNNDTVVVFENKIYHTADNPFTDYFEDIKKKYSGHTTYFVLLSYKPENKIENWQYVSIQQKFKTILELTKFDFTNKWDYFIQDFLTHFTNKKFNMTDIEKKFYENNFDKIISASNNLHQFILNVGETFFNDNLLNRFELSSNWNSETKAIRFYPLIEKSNVVLVFNTNGKFTISIYYYTDHTQYNTDIYNLIGAINYRNWREGNVYCFALRDGISYETLEQALFECKLQIDMMKDYLA